MTIIDSKFEKTDNRLVRLEEEDKMDRIAHTRKFKTSLNESSYEYSDEFLYELISNLASRVEYLEQRIETLESDGK